MICGFAKITKCLKFYDLVVFFDLSQGKYRTAFDTPIQGPSMIGQAACDLRKMEINVNSGLTNLEAVELGGWYHLTSFNYQIITIWGLPP